MSSSSSASNNFTYQADGSIWSFTQSDDQINIQQVIPVNVKPEVKFENNYIYCKLPTEKLPRLDGELYGTVLPFDSIWQLEAISDDQNHKLMTIHLEKSPESIGQVWPLLIKKGKSEEMGCDIQSLYEIGSNAHLSGDVNKAVKYLQVSAEKGCISAQLKLAAWYEIGNGEEYKQYNFPLKKDQAASHQWHKEVYDKYELIYSFFDVKAALLGNAEACYVVATTYLHGTHGVSQDYVEAVKFFKKVYETVNIHKTLPNIYISASFQLGLMFMEGGHGLGDPNPKESLIYWKLSGMAGHPDSIFNIGVFYLNAFGVDQDIPGAIEMIKLARQANPSLNLPPPLLGLSEVELNKYVELSKTIKRGENQEIQDYLKSLVVEVKKLNVKEIENSNDEIKFVQQKKKSNKGKNLKKKKKSKGATFSDEVEDEKIYSFFNLRTLLIVSVLSVGLIVWVNRKK
ncbi:hypothetical protein HDU92_002101 [Lobulomyces angularis]|nr:hypothetical protein HDU92_002101 [Lobulomyces angularis]